MMNHSRKRKILLLLLSLVSTQTIVRATTLLSSSSSSVRNVGVVRYKLLPPEKEEEVAAKARRHVLRRTQKNWGGGCGTTVLSRTIHSISRGGSSSDSRSSWSAGSSSSSPGNKFSFTTTSPPRQRQSQQQQRRGYTVMDYPSGETEEEQKRKTKEAIESFLNRDNRNKFIARVYMILTGQLLVTALSITLFGTNERLLSWAYSKGRTVPLLSLLLSTIAWFMMCSSEHNRRSSPLKWHLLTIFTLGEAIMLGFLSSFYKFQSVVSAMTATAVSTFSITIYTLMQSNPKYDLSQWGTGLVSCGIIFVMYGFINVLELFGILPQGFLPYNETLYSFLGAVLFAFYLAHHTRLIVSGKNTKYQMNDKDYVFGACALYQDVINIFIYLLRLLGEDRNND